MPAELKTPSAFQNLRDFARAACLSERAVFDLRAAGLPHMRVGGKILFNPAVALPWVERHYDATVKPDRPRQPALTDANPAAGFEPVTGSSSSVPLADPS